MRNRSAEASEETWRTSPGGRADTGSGSSQYELWTEGWVDKTYSSWVGFFFFLAHPALHSCLSHTHTKLSCPKFLCWQSEAAPTQEEDRAAADSNDTNSNIVVER